MTKSVPDYTEDWKQYWEFKNSTRTRTRLRKAAEQPVSEYLPISIQDLNPRSEDYQWNINTEHLKNHPDSVLTDAKEGFSKFVDTSDIVDQAELYYDQLSLNFADPAYRLRDYFFEAQNEHVEPNRIHCFSINISKLPEKYLKPSVIMYECPRGHRSRLVQPLYTNHFIQKCTETDCSNSIYQISQGTQFANVIRFSVELGGIEVQCVSSGRYTQDRQLDIFNEENMSVNLVGILRNVVEDNGGTSQILEVLSMNEE